MFSYQPPKDVIRSINPQTKEDLIDYVNICAGIIRWALNTYNIRKTGAEWVYSIFKIREHTPHYFFKYEIGGVRIAQFTILEIIEDMKPFVPMLAYEDIRKSIQYLNSSNAISVDFSRITNEKIKNALIHFIDYVYDDKEIFEGKKVTDIYRGIPVAENSSYGCAIRIPAPLHTDYVGIEELKVTAPVETMCEECGNYLPCCKSKQESYCRHCLDTMECCDHISCQHPECAIYGCKHYEGKIEYENYPWLESEEHK